MRFLSFGGGRVGRFAQGLGDNRRMYLFLLLLTVGASLGLQGWRTMINNFAVEVAGLNGLEIGLVQSMREVPGFFAFTVVYVLLVFSEHRVAAAAVALLGVGVAATGLFPSFAGLMFTITMMSVGFHYFETLNQSLTLQYFDRSTSPVVFGRLKGVASAANLAVGVAIFFAAPLLSYTAMYLCLGALVGAIGLGCLVMHPQRKDLAPQRKKMVVKRKYWLFYALTFMAGSRRQIFGAFAVYLLVKEFGYSVQAVTGLFVLNNVINSFWSPLIGRAINRFGERKVLTVEYAGLFFVFVGYALTRSPAFAAVLYVADHLFFNFAIAIRTYFQKIAEPEDIAPSSAVGFTINHIAAVVVPALGGALWLVDYRIVFISAACMSLGSLALAQFVRVPAPAEAGPSEAAPAGAADRPK